MVPKTVESEVYRREELKRGVQKIWVRMKVGFPVFKLQFYVVHRYDPSQRSMTWTLDYARRSDLDDSVGFWYVVPHPDRPRDASRVYYSVDVSMFAWVPHFVVEFMSQQALVDATAWVKKYSELAQSAKRGGGSSLSSSSLPSRPPPESVTQRPWWWRWRWGGGRYASSSAAAATRTALGVGSGDSVPTLSVKEGHPIPAAVRERRAQVGPKRYVLVTTVLALLLYNVHLYFSQ
jgi:hypothetical protein